MVAANSMSKPNSGRFGKEELHQDFITHDLYVSTFRWVAKRLGMGEIKPPDLTHSPVPMTIEGCRDMAYNGTYRKDPYPKITLYSGIGRSLADVAETMAHESAHACLSTPSNTLDRLRYAEEGVARVVGCCAYARFTGSPSDNISIANILLNMSLDVVQSALVELGTVEDRSDRRPEILTKLPVIVKTLECTDYLIGLSEEIAEIVEKDPIKYSMQKFKEIERMNLVRCSAPDQSIRGEQRGYDHEVKDLFSKSDNALERIGMKLARIRESETFARVERADDFMHYIWSYLGKE